MIYRLLEMLSMQEKYDNKVFEVHPGKFDLEKARIALIDELGEVTHELKGNWCWWKFTQPPVDQDKVLEELADVWHFVLMIQYHNAPYIDKFFNKAVFEKIHNDATSTELHKIISRLISTDTLSVYFALMLTYKLGFTFDEIYEAYKSKHKVNYERLGNGY